MTYDIRRSKAIDMIYLDRVHYGLEDSTLLARFSDAPEVVQMYANFLVAILNKNAEFDFPPDALTKFFILTCESKHPDYADEAEIWLVVAEATEGRENGRSRAPKPAPERVVIKYLDALTTVMIGPARDQFDLIKRVRSALNAAGLERVKITRSKTQYRVA